MLLYSPRWLFFYPGASLMGVGLLMVAILTRGDLRLGAVTLSVHTLVFAGAAVVLGFQSMAFAVLSEAFAAREHLVVSERTNLARRVRLETGLIIGAVLAVAGIAASVAAVAYWSRQSFGQLDPTVVLRWVVPGATCLTLGVQTILSSFFLAFLRVK